MARNPNRSTSEILKESVLVLQVACKPLNFTDNGHKIWEIEVNTAWWHRDDQHPYYNSRDPLADFGASAFLRSAPGENALHTRIYDHEFGVKHVGSRTIDLARAEEIVKVLRKYTKVRQRIYDTEGSSKTIGEDIARIARAIGAESIIIDRGSFHKAACKDTSTPDTYREYTTFAEAISTVNYYVAEVHKKHSPNHPELALLTA